MTTLFRDLVLMVVGAGLVAIHFNSWMLGFGAFCLAFGIYK